MSEITYREKERNWLVIGTKSNLNTITPSCFQRMSSSSSWAFVDLLALFQTELAIDTNIVVGDTHVVVTDTRRVIADTHTVVADTHTVVADTHTVVADTYTAVGDTQTMVADIHRSVLSGGGDTSGKNHSVRATCDPSIKKSAYHHLDSNLVRDTTYFGVLSLTFFTAHLLVNFLPPHRGTVSGVMSWSQRLSGSPKPLHPSVLSVQGGLEKRLLPLPPSTTIGSKNDSARTDDSSAAISFPHHPHISSPDSLKSSARG